MDKIKVGIVGARFAASIHANAYNQSPHVKIVSVAARDEETLKNFCRVYGIERYYLNYQEMLEKEELDMISVCVPNFLHKDVVLSAANSVKNIVCEKPLATSIDDAKLMLDACEKKGVRLMYAENWIFAPAARRMKEICDEGAIGEILYIKGKEAHSGSHSPYAQKVAYCGGGALIHLGIHPIGFIRWFKRKEVVSVFGMMSGGEGGNLKHLSLEGEDWCIGILRFEDGSVGLIESNYLTVGGLDDRIEVYGTKGVIKVDLSQGSPLTVFSLDGYSYSVEKSEITKGWTKPAIDEHYSLGYIDEINHFVECARLNREPNYGVRAIDGLKALEIVFNLYDSAKSGKVVDLKRG